MRSLVFDDFESYAIAVRHADVRMMCDCLEVRRWQLLYWDLPGISLQLSREGGGNLCEGTNRLDRRILYLPLTRTELNSANGEPLDGGSLVVIDPGAEFFITGRRRAHEWATILLPPEPKGPRPRAAPDDAPGCRVVRPANGQIGRLAELVRQFASAAEPPDLLPEPARQAASARLHEAALACLDATAPPAIAGPGRPRLPRHEIIHRCLNSIEDHGIRPINVPALAESASVSERTIRAVFSDYFGLSPSRYLLLRALFRVRRELRRNSAENATVTGILADQGIWEFGRFAGRYRSIFGESPSETLRRRPN